MATPGDPLYFLENQAYTGIAENFASQPWNQVSAQNLFQGAVNQIQPEYERQMQQFREDLNAAGLLTSAAGYGSETPIGQAQKQYQTILANLGLQAQIQAPQIQQSLFGQALSPLMGLWQQRASGDLAWNALQAQIEQQRKAREAASKGANAGMWGQIGNAALGTLGEIVGGGGGFMGNLWNQFVPTDVSGNMNTPLGPSQSSGFASALPSFMALL